MTGNKHNNYYKNLEWASRSEQMKHAYKLGLKKPVDCPHRKLTNEQALEVKARYKPHDKVNGMIALAKEFGVSEATIKRCVKNIYYKNVK